MKIIDLSHFIANGMPVYPGTEAPKLKTSNTYEIDGFKETFLSMSTHTGTHIDPPAHLFGDKMTLDEFNVSQFIGKAIVIDCRDLKDGEQITLNHVKKYGDKISQADFLLFNSGWDKRWGSDTYFGKFPCISDEVIELIVKGNYKGIGFDVISIDPIGDASLTIHKKLFSQKELINVENLKNLDLCGSDLFTFICLPLKIEKADGSPTRAVAILD